MGLGGLLLDEVRRYERSVGLIDIFETPADAGKRDIFRVSSSDGVLYEMFLVGNWQHDTDRLMEFDRPSKNRLRVYSHPTHMVRREAVLERSQKQVEVVLYEMVVPYQDLLVRDVLKMSGAHNLQKMEEDVPVSKFIEVFSSLDDGSPDDSMVRYVAKQEVGEGVREEPMVDSKTCAALGETVFDNMVVRRTGSGWKVTQFKNHVLDTDEGMKVREYARSVGICTYWNDADCQDFADEIVKEDRRDILESRVSFYNFITASRRGEESNLSSFVESKLYPNEPVS